MTSFSFASDTSWRCSACDKDLQPRQVKAQYMGSVFTVELMVCPRCGFVLVTEDLALGKMHEVEQLLEDK